MDSLLFDFINLTQVHNFTVSAQDIFTFRRLSVFNASFTGTLQVLMQIMNRFHGLQSLPPSPKRAERKGRRRPFREAGSGHKQWNTVSCVDTFSIISKFSAQNSKI